jgi:chlorite dismutase
MECRTAEAKARRTAHFAYLEALPLEKRIAKIEEQLYDLNTEQRLRAMEVHHVRY